MRAILLLVAAVLLGLTGGYAWSKWSKPASAHVSASTPAVAAKGPTSHEIEASVHFASCADAKAAGKAPLYPGQPGYSAELDPTGTGVACQPGAAG